MSLGDLCVNMEIVQLKEKVDKQNLALSNHLSKKHSHHMKRVRKRKKKIKSKRKEINLCEDIHIKEQTEFNLCEDIDLKEEVVQEDFDFYDDICVKEEVIQMEMCEGDDSYDTDVNHNPILANYLCEDIYAKEEIIQTEYDLHETIVETDPECEWSHAYDVSETTAQGDLYKEHTVKDELVIGPEVLQLRENTKTAAAATLEDLSEERQRNEKEIHMDEVKREDVHIKKELEPDDACGVSEAAAQGFYEEHIVKDESLQLRDTTGEAATREDLFEDQRKDESENVHMHADKHEANHIKVEREPDDNACSMSEALTQEGLYEGHIVKDDLVIGPEVLQPGDVPCTTGAVCFVSARAPRPACEEKGVFYSCVICRKLLSEHCLAAHTCEVLYTCDICHEVFPTENRMIEHKRYTGEESFDCALCPKKFPSKSCLTVHERVHMGETTFTCEICYKQFRKWFLLNTHMRGVYCLTSLRDKSKFLESTDTVDWNQDWKSDVDSLCDKLSGHIVALSKIAPLHSSAALKRIYFAHFQSVMSHGTLMWGNSEHASRILVLQEQAIRILAGVAPEHPCRPLFISQRILTHYSQYVFELLLFVRINIYQFKCTNLGRLRTVRQSRALSEKNPRIIGPTFYERLPYDLKNEPSDKEFSLRLRNILLETPLYSLSEYMQLKFEKDITEKKRIAEKKTAKKKSEYIELKFEKDITEKKRIAEKKTAKKKNAKKKNAKKKKAKKVKKWKLKQKIIQIQLQIRNALLHAKSLQKKH